MFQFNNQGADLRVAYVFPLMRDWLAPEYIPGFALEDLRGSVRRRVLNAVVGECIEHILRMAMKSFCLARFETKLQNANSIVLKFDCKFLVFLRVRGDRPCE